MDRGNNTKTRTANRPEAKRKAKKRFLAPLIPLDLIRDTGFPPTMRAAAGVLHMFYQDIQPGAYIWFPTQGDLCSGQGNGVEITIVADSYETQHHLQEVVIDYCEDLTTDPWTNITTLAGNTTGNLYNYDWSNSLDDDELWFRVSCQDTGDCESVFYFHWISVDSTSPVISNTSIN